MMVIKKMNNKKMINIEVSIEMYNVLNSIVNEGFSEFYIYFNYINDIQPRNINQVIEHLINMAYLNDNLKEKSIDEYFKGINKKEE